MAKKGEKKRSHETFLVSEQIYSEFSKYATHNQLDENAFDDYIKKVLSEAQDHLPREGDAEPKKVSISFENLHNSTRVLEAYKEYMKAMQECID